MSREEKAVGMGTWLRHFIGRDMTREASRIDIWVHNLRMSCRGHKETYVLPCRGRAIVVAIATHFTDAVSLR